MRSLILLLVLVLVSGCVGVEGREGVGGEERVVKIECRHPRGNGEVYEWEESSVPPYRFRSAMWMFEGKRVSEGKRVWVVMNDCAIEREVGGDGEDWGVI